MLTPHKMTPAYIWVRGSYWASFNGGSPEALLQSSSIPAQVREFVYFIGF